MIYLVFAAGVVSGSIITGLMLGLFRASKQREDEELRAYEQLRIPAWVSGKRPVTIAVPDAEFPPQVTRWHDPSRDAVIYRFRARHAR